MAHPPVPPAPRSRAVLITGCSSGIGRAAAIHLAANGWRVHASARRLETIADLADHGCRLLTLDVCDPDSRRAAVEAVEAQEGSVGVLVNNAGYGLQGPVEELDLDDARAQFETNLFGPLGLTQLVLPAMRSRGEGRIVNVTSVGGRLTIPGGAAYHASKHALEALSDALRFEVRGFGIDVVVIEPGAIRSRWVEKAVGTLGPGASEGEGGPYAALRAAAADQLAGAHRGVLALAAGPPEAVARTIESALTADRPAPRYVVPPLARLFVLARRFLSDRAWDAFLRRMYPSPGPS